MATKSRFSFRLKALPVVILAAFTLGGLASCGGGDADTVVPPPPVIDAEENTGSIALSWAERLSESLYEISLGVAAMAEGNFVAGGGEFAAAFFGIVSKGLESGESGDDQAKELNEIK